MNRSWIALGIVCSGAGLFALGCVSSVTSGGSDNTGGSVSVSSSSSGGGGSGGSGGSGGNGGEVNPAGGSGGTGGAGAAGGGGVGGNLGYASCKECQAETGAAQNECAAEWTACMEWKTCVSYFNCNTNGFPGGPGPCDKTTTAGACCSLQCENTFADLEGIARYRALDACINCQTCLEVCNNGPTYCAVFEAGGDVLCNP